jgi:hypothetical protein
VGDNAGQLAAGAVNLALRGCSIAPLEHAGDQVFDNLELVVVLQHRRVVVLVVANHLIGRRRPARRINEITIKT